MPQPPMKNNSPDSFQSPKSVLEPIYPYLKKDMIIWEPAQGKGNLTAALTEKGYTVIGSDIITGQDFLTWQPERWDVIITNPPYSKKEEFLERCFTLNRPFALLLPLTTFEGRKRQALFREHEIEVIFFNKRINFETPTGIGKSSWFATAFFTSGLHIGRQLTFWQPAKKEDEKDGQVLQGNDKSDKGIQQQL